MLIRYDGVSAMKLSKLMAYIGSVDNRIALDDLPPHRASGIIHIERLFSGHKRSESGEKLAAREQVVRLKKAETKAQDSYTLEISIPDSVRWTRHDGDALSANGTILVPGRILRTTYGILSDQSEN